MWAPFLMVAAPIDHVARADEGRDTITSSEIVALISGHLGSESLPSICSRAGILRPNATFQYEIVHLHRVNHSVRCSIPISQRDRQSATLRRRYSLTDPLLRHAGY